MELYIPPPSHYLPRLPPPRPVLPTVPVVPPPALPDVLHAPEGVYKLVPKTEFPDIEVPGPLPSEITYRSNGLPMGPGSALIGAAGFGVASPSFIPPPLTSPNIFAVSSNSTLVNGQWQPAHPSRLTFADVWYPPRVPGKESSFGALVRRGLGKKDSASQQAAAAAAAAAAASAPPPMSAYDDDMDFYSDGSASPPSSETPLPEAPLAHSQPQLSNMQSPGPRRQAFGRTGAAKGRPEKALSSTRGGIITRVSPNLNLGSIMDDKGKNGGERVRWAFWNMGRLFCWAEEGGIKENLATVVFQSPPTAHAISPLTVGPERQDIVVGLETGDLLYLDFINDRFERYNIGGKVIKQAVTSIHFDPRGGDRFIASFADNTVAQFHLFGEDPTEASMAVIGSLPRPWTTYFEQQQALHHASAKAKAKSNGASSGHSNGVNDNVTPTGDDSTIGEEILSPPPAPKHNSRDAFQDRLLVWKNDEWNAVNAAERDKKGGEKYPWAGRNPLSVFKLGSSKSELTAMAYSPDGRWLAITSKDGLLRLVDTEQERVTDVFESYFSGLTCVAWSPDNRFVAVGGQDDFVTIYSPRESRLVARCQGHTAFVTCIAFDPTMRSEGRGYRFGSVGEDGKLILWDFSVAALRKPRHHHSNSSHFRVAPGSTASLTTSSRAQPILDTTSDDALAATYHPAPPKSEVAFLQPVLARIVEGNLMTSLHMGPRSIATVSRAGSIKFWQRPPRVHASKRGRGKDAAPGSKPGQRA